MFKNLGYFIFLSLFILVRVYFAIKSHIWNSGPDQIAWGILIDDLQINGYKGFYQLLHYPHEGGSILLSLLTLFIPLKGLTSLSVLSILWVSLSSIIQLWIIKQVFDRKASFYYGLWSICAIPILIYWSSLNFGLHYLASIFPFLLLYVWHKPINLNRKSIYFGVLVGLSISFAFDNLILIIFPIIYVLIGNETFIEKVKSSLLFLFAAVLCISPFFLIKFTGNIGFDLEELNLFSIRGLEWNAQTWSEVQHALKRTFHIPIIGSSLIPDISGISKLNLRWLWYFILLTGIIVSILKQSKKSLVILSIIALFQIAYALSPLFVDDPEIDKPIHFRHICYILPLMISLGVVGLSKNKFGQILFVLFTLMSSYASINFIQNSDRVNNQSTLAAGWVLGKKLGHDVDELFKIAEFVPDEAKEELIKGYVWGITATTLGHKEWNDSAKISQFVMAKNEFPTEFGTLFNEGYELAFEVGVTPVLDTKLKSKIDLYVQ
jgi:hypothetical protein